MNKKSLSPAEVLIGFAVGLLLAAGIILLLNFLPWLAWNCVLVPLFGLPTVTFWQMLVVTWFMRFIAVGILGLGRVSKS